jgi:DNA invertase Pin-like site-specific DNA recombinase
MRAWLYYRLSRDEDQEMNSLQNQRQILVDYAEQNGYEIVGESFYDNVSETTFMPRTSARNSRQVFAKSRKEKV